MKNKIDDLRNHLFETLEALKDDEKPMAIDRAMAIAEVAKVLVESAKVEVGFLKATGALKSTDFLPSEEDAVQIQRKRLAIAGDDVGGLVHFESHAVPEPVREELAVPGTLDHRTGRAIDLLGNRAVPDRGPRWPAPRRRCAPPRRRRPAVRRGRTCG